MIKKFLVKAAAIIVAAISTVAFSASAAELTIFDVMDEARAYGFSEDLIQEIYVSAQQHPEAWTQQNFRDAMDYIHINGSLVITTGPQVTNDKFTTTTIAAAQTTEALSNTAATQPASGGASQGTVTAAAPTDTPIQTTAASGNDVPTATTQVAPSGGGQTVQTTAHSADPSAPAPPSSSDPVPTAPSGNSSITLTMPDGTTFTRMSVSDFIALSYRDKQAYIATFPPAQQQVIIDNLTPEEYRSLMKQAPSDTKVEIVDNMANAMQQVGIHTTVDELTDDSIKLTFRDENGEIVGISNVKTKVEDTGYDRRGVFAFSAGMCLLAALLLAVLIRRSFGGKNGIEENE